MSSEERHRVRDLGIGIGDLQPGPYNAITDVAGVEVGHTTLIHGDGPLVVGSGPVRTGVSVLLPRGGADPSPVFAASHVLNGNGEMTGLAWVAESGLLTTPVAITNTHSVGVVRDALVQYHLRASAGAGAAVDWSLPVVAETWDGTLSDINGSHVTAAHVEEALAAARGGPVEEGCVGGGTGMVCHGFKGGIGTSSRLVPHGAGAWTVGVLVQANHGTRRHLRVDGVPVGRHLTEDLMPPPRRPDVETGSVIVVVATDAPCLPDQCRRLAQRASLGVGRTGALGGDSSGDLFLAFSTGNAGLDPGGDVPIAVRMVPHGAMTSLFEAVVDATEEAVLNALCMATTMTGIDGVTAHAMPLDAVRELVVGRAG